MKTKQKKIYNLNTEEKDAEVRKFYAKMNFKENL